MLWAVTCLFNHTPKRVENYSRLLRSMKECQIPLMTVEMETIGGWTAGFSEAVCSDSYLLCRGDLMWQKERLLNIGIEHLPSDCDRVLVIDADCIPWRSNPGYKRRVNEALDKCDVAQGYERIGYMEKGNGFIDTIVDSFAYAIYRDGSDKVEKRYDTIPPSPPAQGGAWAFNREWIKKVGLYDKFIVGSADSAFSWAIAGLDYMSKPSRPKSLKLDEDLARWIAKMPLTRFRHVKADMRHLWHGEISNRQYRERHALLNDFDPETDITMSVTGPWKWTDSARKKGLPEKIAGYFESRRDA